MDASTPKSPKGVPTPLPIGKSFFDMVIEDGCYYVDKTLFIKEILDRRAAVILCTRPRRFGKTLNQTMLKCFFEDTAPLDVDGGGGKDTRALFAGLRIEAAGEEYMRHQGGYPVVFLSFKEGKRATFEQSIKGLREELVLEFYRHRYVVEKISKKEEVELFERLTSGVGTVDDYAVSLKFLCRCLEAYHGKKAIVLIDEYDVPLENAWFNKFYKEMIDFVRPLLSSALKDNASLQFAVMTGCLRVSKESIFTGLNNLDVVSILSERYDEYFGFTQGEMDTMLGRYGMDGKREVVKNWYNGYLFGSKEVYNPWSSILVVAAWLDNIDKPPCPYWANTSSNEIVHELIVRASDDAKADIETLMAGGTISKLIQEDVVYEDMYKSAENLWGFLFFTGYLKKVGETVDSVERRIVELKIPNKEVNIVYYNKISEWFEEKISGKDNSAFFRAILSGDAETFQGELKKLLDDSISFMDSAENFYHGFMAGVLSRLKGYAVKSNRESGDGRSDIVVYGGDKAFIFELKVADRFKSLPEACEKALRQIEDKNYAAYWADEGYFEIVKYGVAFYKKKCAVMMGE